MPQIMKNIGSTQRKFWNEATTHPDLRNEWICDKNVTDEQCLDAILPHLKKGKTLDLGCGIGRLTQGYGVDVSPKMLELADKLNPGEYKVCDGESIPYPDNFFDNVFSLCVFQHIPDSNKEAYIKEAYRVLKPGGIFRLQYVEGSEIAPMSYQTYHFDLYKFDIKEIEKGLIFKEWMWLTLKK